jgi:hypothetical protein
MRVCILLLAACTTTYVGPGVMISPRWQEPRRDPDPTVDPTKQATENPWQEQQKASAQTLPSYTAEYAIAATLAIVLGGFVPMFIWAGTFEENRLGPTQGKPRRAHKGPAVKAPQPP